MKKLGTTIYNIIGFFLKVAMILAILPIPGFAIRGAFPMSNPDFKGLSYWQLTEWRWWDFERLDRETRLRLPGEPDFPCFELEYGIKLFGVPMQGFVYAVNGLRGMKPTVTNPYPENVTIWNFPAKWNETNEYLLWYNLDVRHVTPSKGECDSGRNIPSAEEFEATIEGLKARVAELDAQIAERDGEQE